MFSRAALKSFFPVRQDHRIHPPFFFNRSTVIGRLPAGTITHFARPHG
ncbi:hypothetical protein NBRC111894_2237 [Sporolactobacillus inulinus]|uniref:Uncharacterized protein n=1 Tax=Sporolactobacillus inulinus TaxID=2078 RepID=A0A4Y1ZCJ7_9BACL|nr:hypothetical protein NBRC111894_2237 [Sporolactobacillus inulinus]